MSPTKNHGAKADSQRPTPPSSTPQLHHQSQLDRQQERHQCAQQSNHPSQLQVLLDAVVALARLTNIPFPLADSSSVPNLQLDPVQLSRSANSIFSSGSSQLFSSSHSRHSPHYDRHPSSPQLQVSESRPSVQSSPAVSQIITPASISRSVGNVETDRVPSSAAATDKTPLSSGVESNSSVTVDVDTIALLASFLQALHDQLASNQSRSSATSVHTSPQRPDFSPAEQGSQNSRRPPLCSIALKQIKIPTNEHDATLLGMTAPVDDLDVGLDGVPVESDDELDPDYLEQIRQRSSELSAPNLYAKRTSSSCQCSADPCPHGISSGGHAPDPDARVIREGTSEKHVVVENDCPADRATPTIDHALLSHTRLRAGKPPRASSTSISRRTRKDTPGGTKPTYRSQPIMGRPRRISSSRSLRHTDHDSVTEFPGHSTAQDAAPTAPTATLSPDGSSATGGILPALDSSDIIKASHVVETDAATSLPLASLPAGSVSPFSSSFDDMPRVSPPSRIQLRLSSTNSFATFNSGSRPSFDGNDGAYGAPDRVQLHADYACIFQRGSGMSTGSQTCSAIKIAARELYVPGPIESHWKIGRSIGCGGFSVVKRGRRIPGAKVIPDVNGRGIVENAAIKFLDKSLTRYMEMHVAREVFTARLFRLAGGNDHVVNVYEVYEDKKYVYIVMELLEGGELFQRISSYGPYTEKFAANLVVSMLDGLSFCHRLNVTHRDVKAENFVFRTKHSTHQGTFSDGIDLKLIDFGVCFYDEDPNALCKTMAGSATYVAPEIVSRNAYGPEADMWSLGVLVYIMLVGYPPFDDNDLVLLIRKIRYKPPEFNEYHWNRISKEARDFVSNLLDKDPMSRMTSRQALEHEWLRNNCHAATDAQLDVQDRLRQLAGDASFSDGDQNDSLSPLPRLDAASDAQAFVGSTDVTESLSEYVPGDSSLGLDGVHSRSSLTDGSIGHGRQSIKPGDNGSIPRSHNDAVGSAVEETTDNSQVMAGVAGRDSANYQSNWHRSPATVAGEGHHRKEDAASVDGHVVDTSERHQAFSGDQRRRLISGLGSKSRRPKSERNFADSHLREQKRSENLLDVRETGKMKSDERIGPRRPLLDDFASISLGNLRRAVPRSQDNQRSASLFQGTPNDASKSVFDDDDAFPGHGSSQRRFLSDGDSLLSSGVLRWPWRQGGGESSEQSGASNARGLSGILSRLSARGGTSGNIDVDDSNLRGSRRWTRHGISRLAPLRRSQKTGMKKCFGADKGPLPG